MLTEGAGSFVTGVAHPGGQFEHGVARPRGQGPDHPTAHGRRRGFDLGSPSFPARRDLLGDVEVGFTLRGRRVSTHRTCPSSRAGAVRAPHRQRDLVTLRAPQHTPAIPAFREITEQPADRHGEPSSSLRTCATSHIAARCGGWVLTARASGGRSARLARAARCAAAVARRATLEPAGEATRTSSASRARSAATRRSGLPTTCRSCSPSGRACSRRRWLTTPPHSCRVARRAASRSACCAAGARDGPGASRRPALREVTGGTRIGRRPRSSTRCAASAPHGC